MATKTNQLHRSGCDSSNQKQKFQNLVEKNVDYTFKVLQEARNAKNRRELKMVAYAYIFTFWAIIVTGCFMVAAVKKDFIITTCIVTAIAAGLVIAVNIFVARHDRLPTIVEPDRPNHGYYDVELAGYNTHVLPGPLKNAMRLTAKWRSDAKS